jgi:hypothetical protein
VLEPAVEVLKPPVVHPDLSALVAVCRARNYVAQWVAG